MNCLQGTGSWSTVGFVGKSQHFKSNADSYRKPLKDSHAALFWISRKDSLERRGRPARKEFQYSSLGMTTD